MIAYDIVQDRRRSRVMKLLKGFGFHAQKSVFECYLDENQLGRLLQQLERLIDPDMDSIRVYPLPLEGVSRVRLLGRGELPELQGVQVVQRS